MSLKLVLGLALVVAVVAADFDMLKGLKIDKVPTYKEQMKAFMESPEMAKAVKEKSLGEIFELIEEKSNRVLEQGYTKAVAEYISALGIGGVAAYIKVLEDAHSQLSPEDIETVTYIMQGEPSARANLERYIKSNF